MFTLCFCVDVILSEVILSYGMSMETSSGNIQFASAADGTALRVGNWKTTGTPAGTVVIVHGRAEFIEKYAEVTRDLNARSLDVWAMDWRGQGLSDRMFRRRHLGHIDRFETYLDDLARFFDTIVKPRTAPVVCLAHSMGGHVAVRAVLERRIAPDGLVTTAPMIALPMSRLGSMGAALLSDVITLIGFGGRYGPRISDHDPARIRFDGNLLTGDRNRFDQFNALLSCNPDLALGGVTWGWLSAAFRSMAQLKRLTPDIGPVCPALICTPLKDRVVSVEAQFALSEAVNGWEQVRFNGARHELMMETDTIRDQFWSVFDEFVKTL